MWTPYKHLQKVVESNLSGQSQDIAALEMILRKNKPNFINLLKNSVRIDEFTILKHKRINYVIFFAAEKRQES